MLGDRLKKQRKAKSISQIEMASKLGITRQGYSHYETDRNEPDHKTLVKIAEILECSVDYLLGRSDKPYPKDIAAETQTPYDENLIHALRHNQEALSFIKLYLNASDQQQKQIRDFVVFILEQTK